MTPRDAPDSEPERLDAPPSPVDLAELALVEAELDKRWPETKIEPSLTRIAALMDLLGSPQNSYPAIHVAGTNGKTSVVRMIDSLLRALHRRTGRTTSPHLQVATERIGIDGQPISPRRYVDTYREILPYVEMIDAQSQAAGGPAMSKFEVLTAMAFAAFAEAPVDVAVVEVGLGGRWDATNVVDGQVAVVTPIGLDHIDYLGADLADDRGGEGRNHQARAEQLDSAGHRRGDRRSSSPRRWSPAARQQSQADAAVARAGSEFAGARPAGRGRRSATRTAGARRGVRRDLPAAARRASGSQCGARAGRGRGVLRGRRGPPTRYRGGAGGFAT